MSRLPSLATLFLLFALPTGLACALLTPIGNVSDEPQHIVRADGLRLGQVLGYVPRPYPTNLMAWPTGFGGVQAQGPILAVSISEIGYTNPDKPLPAAVQATARAIPWSGQKFFCPTQMVNYFPVFYAPAALGLWSGETLGLTPLHTVFLGRVFMLAAYLALGWGALALAQFGAALLFAVLTLPTALTLGASYNQDGLMIASAALAAALLTRAKPGPDDGAWRAGLGLMELIAIAKAPYVALILAWAPPLGAQGLRKRLALLALALIPPGLWIIYQVHAHFCIWPRLPYAAGPLWPGWPGQIFTDVESARNIAVLQAHPAQILWLPLTSLWAEWRATWPQMLGMVDYDCVPIWPWEFPALAVALLVAALDAAPWHPQRATAVALGLFGAFIAVELSLYISFTSTGETIIGGVWGRYFLPLMPFFMFLLPGLKRPASRWFALPALALAAVNMVALPGFIFHIYQMLGP